MEQAYFNLLLFSALLTLGVTGKAVNRRVIGFPINFRLTALRFEACGVYGIESFLKKSSLLYDRR